MRKVILVALLLSLGWHGGYALAKEQMHGDHTTPAHPAEGRAASGTAWQPAASPMYAHHREFDEWRMMLHYNVFLTYITQEGPRGDEQLGSTNWAMLMGERDLGTGRLMLRGMLSLERATTGGDGYPLLFQSGESWHGEPLVDRQHPHDFLMELAARYDHPFGAEQGGFLYVAPSGEPALGPVAYPHRLSALDFPLAPLGHHWQDSTHIAFGVLTAGIYSGRWQAEASYFNGREPDEERWGIDPIALDSHAGRLTFNPTPNWSLSASHGFLRSPEALHPEEDVRRSVLSALYTQPFADGLVAATAVWGRNDHNGDASDSYLLEGQLTRAHRHTLFVRLENIEKTGEELASGNGETLHTISAGTLAYLYDLQPHRAMQVGIGAGVTEYRIPGALKDEYGDARAYLLYLRIRPARMPPVLTR